MEPRTNPTVMTSPMNNRKNLERREIRLGMVQVVGLLGLAVGSVAAAFCLGFFAGRSVGFEREISNMIAGLPKIPIDGVQASDEVGDQVVNEVFAKLNEQTPPKPSAIEEPVIEGGPDYKQPDLESIENAPSNTGGKGEDTQLGKVLEDSEVEVTIDKPSGAPPEIKDNDSSIDVIGDTVTLRDSGQKKEETLGNVISGNQLKDKGAGDKIAPPVKEQEKVLEKVVEAPPAKSPTSIVLKEEKPKDTNQGLQVKEVKSEVLPTPKAVVAKGIEPVSPVKKIPSGWFAQVAAPKKLDDANALTRSLKSSGFAVVIESAEVRGENYYRILVGPEQNKAQADILLKQLKRESYIKGEPFIRMVK